MASTQTREPVFRVHAQGADHGFVVIGDKRTLSGNKLVVVDPWPTFPMAHTVRAGAFKIGETVSVASAEADPRYQLDDGTLLRNSRYFFPDVSVDDVASIERFNSINTMLNSYMQWFSIKDSRRGMDYKGMRGEGGFNRLPEPYVMDRLTRYSNYVEVGRRAAMQSSP